LERLQVVFWRVSVSYMVGRTRKLRVSDTGYRYATAPEGDEDAICPAFQRESRMTDHNKRRAMSTAHPRNRRPLRPHEPVPSSPLHWLFPSVPPNNPLHLTRPIYNDVFPALFTWRRPGTAPHHAIREVTRYPLGNFLR
jgi:hypothetical protein